MPRTPLTDDPDQPRTGTRAEAMRAGLLDAAREVFVGVGYIDASVTKIVERAGASVGSLYHHFGGKPDIFIALYEEHEARLSRSAAAEVARARVGGESDPVTLFVCGARGYLEQCRRDSDLTALFLGGDGPPGFNAMRRQVAAEWVRQNGRLIRAEERRNGHALVTVLTTVSGSAGREVAAASTDELAAELVDDFCELIGRVADE
ncbi:MAG: TetR/AcrR family transcriptional regulator [Cumulibacter sp.]